MKMKKILIGAKSYSYLAEWREVKSRKEISDAKKLMKLHNINFSLTVKGVYDKKNIYNIAEVEDKELKADLKIENSAGALALSAYYKAIKKPDSFNLAPHTLKESKSVNERPFDKTNDVNAKNWILVFSAEDKEEGESGFWVSVIMQGSPWLENFDVFWHHAEAFKKQNILIDHIMNGIKNTPNREEDFVFISDRKDILDKFQDIFYSNENANDKSFESICTSFDSLVENIKQPSIEKVQTTLIEPKYILGVVVLAGMGFGVNYWMEYREEMENQEQMLQSQKNSEKTKEKNLKMQKEYEELKAKTLKETLAEANRELNEKISVGDPNLTINSWLDVIYKVKLNHNGWTLKTINCSIVKERPSCVVELSREKLATNKNLILYYPEAKISGDKATYTLKSEDKIDYKKQNYLTLPNPQTFLIDTVSSLQKLVLSDVSFNIGASQEITKAVVLPEPPSKVIRQNMNVDPIKMGVSAGTLKLTGKGAYLLNGLKTWLDDPTLKIEKIKVSVDNGGNVSWELNGNYFVKIADEPTLPEIPPSIIGVPGMER